MIQQVLAHVFVGYIMESFWPSGRTHAINRYHNKPKFCHTLISPAKGYLKAARKHIGVWPGVWLVNHRVFFASIKIGGFPDGTINSGFSIPCHSRKSFRVFVAHGKQAAYFRPAQFNQYFAGCSIPYYRNGGLIGCGIVVGEPKSICGNAYLMVAVFRAK